MNKFRIPRCSRGPAADYRNMSPRSGCGLLASIDGKHASVNTKEHAVYAYFFLGFSIARIATIYRKGNGTMGRWIERYSKSRNLSRLSSNGSNAKFSQEQRRWILK